MFLVTINNLITGVAEQYAATSIETRPSTFFTRPYANEVLLYGSPLMQANFPDRKDAAQAILTDEPIRIIPFFEPVERPNGY